MLAALEGLDIISKSLSYSLLNYGRVVVHKDKGGAFELVTFKMRRGANSGRTGPSAGVSSLIGLWENVVLLAKWV